MSYILYLVIGLDLFTNNDFGYNQHHLISCGVLTTTETELSSYKMESKIESAVIVADDASKNDRTSHEKDLESDTGAMGNRSGAQLKRDLGSRHINMIAIAGMIVSFSEPRHFHQRADLV